MDGEVNSFKTQMKISYLSSLKKFTSLCLLAGLLFLAGCEGCEGDKPKPERKTETRKVDVPDFNSDSAYAWIEQQVAFGPRVPGTPEHEQTVQFLTAELKRFADSVHVQKGNVRLFNNRQMPVKNIMAWFGPQKKKRILLCAHYDTRPFADQDTVRTDEPIPGANDGGSGVGVLLEMARHFSQKQPDVGVVIILFDVEDYGMSEVKHSYALGSQYWARSIDQSRYFADYGILLDMVGAKNARFFQEGYSMDFASFVVKKVWDKAVKLGHSNYFIYRRSGYIDDDHYYVNTLARIPTIDIIDYDRARSEKGFGAFWHTHNDNMDIIDRNTLKAVGQTVMSVVYEEPGL